MSIRPGQAKGPYVGLDGGAADGKVLVSGNDTTSGYLSDELLAGPAHITTILSPSADEKLEIKHAIQGFWDDFAGAAIKPFWQGNDAITSGRWQVSLANDRLEGIGGTSEQDTLLYGIEGDFDYLFKITPAGSSISTAFIITDGTNTYRLVDFSGNLEWEVTGKSKVTITQPASTYWIRQKRIGETISAWYKINDTDPWTQVGSDVTDTPLGYDAKLKLDAANGSYILETIFFDNIMPQRIRSQVGKKFVILTDGATINIDATYGNKFHVTIAGNRTIANPTNENEEQLLMIAIKQDVTGSRTITWGSNYRFPGGTAPTLTTTGSKTDYLGFFYNSIDSKWDNIAFANNL